jgi:hypothetical protein
MQATSLPLHLVRPFWYMSAIRTAFCHATNINVSGNIYHATIETAQNPKITPMAQSRIMVGGIAFNATANTLIEPDVVYTARGSTVEIHIHRHYVRPVPLRGNTDRGRGRALLFDADPGNAMSA